MARFETFGDLIHVHPHIQWVVFQQQPRGQPTPARPAEQKGPSAREARIRWAALIQQVYELDPLICPKCGATMKIISFIQRHQNRVIEKSLRHCGLWEGQAFRGPPAPEQPVAD